MFLQTCRSHESDNAINVLINITMHALVYLMVTPPTSSLLHTGEHSSLPH